MLPRKVLILLDFVLKTLTFPSFDGIFTCVSKAGVARAGGESSERGNNYGSGVSSG